MNKLIQTDDLWKGVDPAEYYFIERLEEILKNTQTVDVIEVVRCKDCKWHEDVDYCVNFMVFGFEGDDYCSWGERREDDKSIRA